MDTATRIGNHRKLFKYVKKYTAAFWGSSFIKELDRIDIENDDQAGSEPHVNGVISSTPQA